MTGRVALIRTSALISHTPPPFSSVKVKAIMREMKQLEESLPVHPDSAIFFRQVTEDIPMCIPIHSSMVHASMTNPSQTYFHAMTRSPSHTPLPLTAFPCVQLSQYYQTTVRKTVIEKCVSLTAVKAVIPQFIVTAVLTTNIAI